jgi:signal transduction histidine kinase
LFACIHSDTEPGGCGTAENCRYCGAIQAVLESKKVSGLVVKEAILNLKMNGKMVPANFRVSSKPFDWKGDTFCIVTMEDISSIKRKEQLERTFFHDIKNKAGIVSGFLQILKNSDSSAANDMYLEIAERGISELVEEIEYQQTFVRAEKGELEVSEQEISAREIVENTLEDYKKMANQSEINLQMNPREPDCILQTDQVLLKRTLGNLVKNAIEACVKGDTVSAGYTCSNHEVTFTVANPAVIPTDIKSQIFSRSFSTKGTGRGIGTYSIRLLTEDYLKGKVSFSSEKPEGTTFRVVLPLKRDQ